MIDISLAFANITAQLPVTHTTSKYLGRVDIYVKLSVIVGARSPRPSPNAGGEPLTILVE